MTTEIIDPAEFFKQWAEAEPERKAYRKEKLKTIKNRFERFLIRGITAQGSAISIANIYLERKVVDVGLYAMSLSFLNPLQKSYLAMLVNWCKYVLMETKYVIK